MKITVKLYGTLRRQRPAEAEGAAHQSFPYQVDEGATVQSLTKVLGIEDGFMNAAAVNGTAVEPTAPLHEGDVVHLFPPAAGGQH